MHLSKIQISKRKYVYKNIRGKTNILSLKVVFCRKFRPCRSLLIFSQHVATLPRRISIAREPSQFAISRMNSCLFKYLILSIVTSLFSPRRRRTSLFAVRKGRRKKGQREKREKKKRERESHRQRVARGIERVNDTWASIELPPSSSYLRYFQPCFHDFHDGVTRPAIRKLLARHQIKFQTRTHTHTHTHTHSQQTHDTRSALQVIFSADSSNRCVTLLYTYFIEAI